MGACKKRTKASNRMRVGVDRPHRRRDGAGTSLDAQAIHHVNDCASEPWRACPPPHPQPRLHGPPSASRAAALHDFERNDLERLLRCTAGNISAAAFAAEQGRGLPLGTALRLIGIEVV